MTVWRTPIYASLEAAIPSAIAPIYDVLYVVPGTGVTLKVKGTTDVPTGQLMRWMREHVPADASIAVNALNGNMLPAYMPQLVPAWPLAFWDPLNYCTNFSRFCEAANVSVQKYGVQPFFNDRESREERLGFLKRFNISYVLVDPATSSMMKTVLAQYPDLFTEEYSEREWHVFRVHLGSAPAAAGS